jgi:hypothetical protein
MKKSQLQQIIQEEITNILSEYNAEINTMRSGGNTLDITSLKPDDKDPNVDSVMSRLKPVATSLKNIDTPKELVNLFSQMLDLIQGLNKSSLSDQEIIMAFTSALNAYRKKK